MKILALLPTNHFNQPGAIVQVDGVELSCIVGGSQYAKPELVKVGQDVKIHVRFNHAQDILNEAAAAKKLPQMLRAFADTLETIHPSIDAITDPVIDASWEDAK